MQKIYAGSRLRRLRESRNLTQLALAKTLELSPSYLNQLENDQRPLTVQVLLKLNTMFELDPAFFATDTDARLVADLHDVLTETSDRGEVSMSEVHELVSRMPDVGRTLVALHRRLHAATDQVERLSAGLDGRGPDIALDSRAPMPYEEVRDFFYDRRNHIPELDVAAEELFFRRRLTIGALDLQLAQLIYEDHGISVAIRDDDPGALGPKRVFDESTRTLTLARRLTAGQRAYQIATQLAFVSHSSTIAAVVDSDTAMSTQSRELARVGLANYFAGALLLPYRQFLAAAESLRYDIEMLSLTFEVGFETVCHRLSTLQRPGAKGVPFFFVRTDRAGNISKRQSATAFHFSRVGGSCPLWVVHDAFAASGRILTQIATMPDDRSYLWIARTTDSGGLGYRSPRKSFAIGLGCDIAYANKLVYADGLPLDSPSASTPIGPGCKVCERTSCAQRAFPQLGRPLVVDDNVDTDLPYPYISQPPART
ncbi:Cro/Cl family transcriptional regulator [Rhodococcus sp. 1163]|uniref:short-chain fatty acyl-CoA regulator family protein n=1 Tax=unclassified Rhodococcus (in: high G+C Gram-positive bacteria) TaxID=192944 RepID=UPI000A04EC33|nr:short-chain fatty acyl-CoA regulator family protein [Rhodococcus sp. 1163]ORI14010.1 Cro/Cl family transcriptional regulator [Rhodococcus sp. 1163]